MKGGVRVRQPTDAPETVTLEWPVRGVGRRLRPTARGGEYCWVLQSRTHRSIEDFHAQIEANLFGVLSDGLIAESSILSTDQGFVGGFVDDFDASHHSYADASVE